MLRQRLLSKASGLKIAPSLQCIVDKAIEVATNPNSSTTDILKIVELDPGISAKILSISNSAYYNRGTITHDINHALIKIGFDEAKNILLCLLLVENMLRTLKLKFRDLLEYWKHSLYVASSARIFAEKSLEYNPKKAYMASLLHDIGKIILYGELENYMEMASAAYEKGISIWNMEREEYGADHQEIGYIIAKKWRLPEEICSVIKNHHNPDYGEEKFSTLIKINKIADNFYYMKESKEVPEMTILLKEKNNIMKEMEKNMEIISIHKDGR